MTRPIPAIFLRSFPCRSKSLVSSDFFSPRSSSKHLPESRIANSASTCPPVSESRKALPGDVLQSPLLCAAFPGSIPRRRGGLYSETAAWVPRPSRTSCLTLPSRKFQPGILSPHGVPASYLLPSLIAILLSTLSQSEYSPPSPHREQIGRVAQG